MTRARIDRLLELAWEADREPVRIEVTRYDLAELGSSRAHYRGVRVEVAAVSRLILKAEPGKASAVTLPGDRHWRLELYGFDGHVVNAPTLAAARWRDFKAAREAGYFNAGGFAAYLANLSVARAARPAEIEATT